ncbi:5910_t:CDS:2 [Ambispora gerdemannii]|uniref:5910_t:CDS:1 n=1 Tax=Ambispora gerdemannii TaxID=144530 RepID=A0A9N9AA14_9GLOM|nr:5910_t:CDS:2 [Ambispora gerdemannii]
MISDPEEKNYSQASIKKIYETDVQIKRLASFTKIKFTKISNSLIPAIDTNYNNEETRHVLRRYTYFGATYGLAFSLIFDVDETNACVKKTKVNVGFGAKSELGKFIEFVEHENNIHIFFKGLISYARLNQQRTRLFEALKRKYHRSLLISSSSSTNEYLEPEEKQDFGDAIDLTLYWRNTVSRTGHVVPNIQLIPRVPPKWEIFDEKNLVSQLPAQFLKLVQLKGVQGAVEVCVRCIFDL